MQLRVVAFTACKESIAVLRYLLQKALKGQLRGLAVCYWTIDGGSHVLLTGAYHAQPKHALAAADLIKVEAAHQLDLFA